MDHTAAEGGRFAPTRIVSVGDPATARRLSGQGARLKTEIHPVAWRVILHVTSRRSRAGARYAHVADELRAAIAGGRLQPGTRLSSERALAGEFDVSRATIVSALHLLRGEGLIERPARRRLVGLSASVIASTWMLKVGHAWCGPRA